MCQEHYWRLGLLNLLSNERPDRLTACLIEQDITRGRKSCIAQFPTPASQVACERIGDDEFGHICCDGAIRTSKFVVQESDDLITQVSIPKASDRLLLLLTQGNGQSHQGSGDGNAVLTQAVLRCLKGIAVGNGCDERMTCLGKDWCNPHLVEFHFEVRGDNQIMDTLIQLIAGGYPPKYDIRLSNVAP